MASDRRTLRNPATVWLCLLVLVLPLTYLTGTKLLPLFELRSSLQTQQQALAVHSAFYEVADQVARRIAGDASDAFSATALVELAAAQRERLIGYPVTSAHWRTWSEHLHDRINGMDGLTVAVELDDIMACAELFAVESGLAVSLRGDESRLLDATQKLGRVQERLAHTRGLLFSNLPEPVLNSLLSTTTWSVARRMHYLEAKLQTMSSLTGDPLTAFENAKGNVSTLLARLTATGPKGPYTWPLTGANVIDELDRLRVDLDSRIAGRIEQRQTQVQRDMLFSIVLWVSALLIGIGVALQLNRAARRESHLLRSLEEKELVYRMAVDNANVGIMDRPDVNAPAQNWSDQLYALLRFPLDTPPVPLLALVHHDQRSLVEQVHAQLSERAMTRQFQAPLLCGDGKYRWFSINAVSTLDPLSNTLRLSGAVIDIDEIKEAERLRASEAELARTVKELTVANSDLERFADMASHDLQEPLRMVTNFVSLLEAEYAPQLDSDAKEYIGIAYDAAHRMQIMLDDMLEYARSGRESVELTPVNLAETVETVSAVLAERIDTQGATIEHESLPTILADDPGMRSVLQNLISNALKYRHPDRPPVIRVGFRQDCERWFLTVTDNGMGIDVRNFVNIFKPFKRLHASSEFSGTGMGLALVHKTVQRWGGDIDVDSTPDCGSTFTISVPQPADHQLRGAA